LQVSQHPILRAQYGDFLWERRHDHRAAHAAVSAYLQAADIYLVTVARNAQAGSLDQVPALVRLADALDRAAELAQLLGDPGLIDRTKAKVFDTAFQLTATRHQDSASTVVDLLDTLNRFGKLLTIPDLTRLVQLAEQEASAWQAEGEHLSERRFLELVASGYGALGQQAEARAARARIGASYEGEANAADRQMVALEHCRSALKIYAEIGDTVKTEKLKQRISAEATATESGLGSKVCW
jgi:hypothetical protein